MIDKPKEKFDVRMVQQQNSYRKGANPFNSYTKFQDGVDYVHNDPFPVKTYTFAPIIHKLPLGIHSHARERERREHTTERIQYEVVGMSALSDHGTPSYPVFDIAISSV
jgi:hypothetical protein